MKLVTGGTSRIGREIVKQLGDDVLVHYHSNKLLAQQPSKNIIQADLSTRKKVDAFLSRLGKFEVIINNFGFYDETNMDFDEWEKFMRVNVIMPAMLMNHIDSGVVVNISSVAAHPGYQTGPLYGATKAALNKFTESSRKPGVRVNAVAPSSIDSYISVTEVAEEVVRIVNSTLDNQVIYLWGTDPGKVV